MREVGGTCVKEAVKLTVSHLEDCLYPVSIGCQFSLKGLVLLVFGLKVSGHVR